MQVELSKRYSFLELVVGSVHAHLMFFRNGTELLGRMEAPINDALHIGEHLRRQETERKVSTPSGPFHPKAWPSFICAERGGRHGVQSLLL